jgi:hypothetical protein
VFDIGKELLLLLESEFGLRKAPLPMPNETEIDRNFALVKSFG